MCVCVCVTGHFDYLLGVFWENTAPSCPDAWALLLEQIWM